jgi:hypothetical protein
MTVPKHTSLFKKFLTLTACSVLIGYGSLAISNDESECPKDENWVQCRAQEGDVLAIYMVARQSYDREYEKVKEGGLGDFSESLVFGRELVDRGERNGKRLLKMVHLQLSWGNHVNRDQALAWLKEDNQQRELDYLPVLINRLAPGSSN